VRRAIGIGAVAVVIVLALAQFLLPSLAASRLRDRLARSGRVVSVAVSAFPAIELLWHRAGTVTVRLASYRSSPSGLDRLLDEAGDVGSLSATVATLRSGRLSLTDVAVHKRGDELSGSARISEAALRAAVPFLSSLSLVSSSAGTLTLEGTATALGISATATVESSGGRLVVVPDLPLVGGLLTLTVFADPHVDVQGVSGSSVAGGLSLSARARLN
jgi:hypothetical protein